MMPIRSALAALMALQVPFAPPPRAFPSPPGVVGSPADTLSLTPAESTALSAVGDWIRVSRADPPIWPGYDPARVPTIAYVPDRWAMILVPPPGIEEALAPLPEGWPDPGVPAAIRTDGPGELVGQLTFDAEVGETVAVAVPLQTEVPPGWAGDLRLANFVFVAHEAFHQYQRRSFGSVETRPEERYPILDAYNTAWASVEMRILADALGASTTGDTVGARDLAESFVAVRSERWGRLDEQAREIERQKEHVEGTAKYVEVRTVGRLDGRDEASYLEGEFERYLEAGALRPADVARNRVYAVGAAVGLLLDVFDPEWKAAVESEEIPTGLARRLERVLGITESRREALVAEAREDRVYEFVWQTSNRLVAEHVEAFLARESELEEGPGPLVEFSAPRLSRSRGSREPRLTIDRGERVIGRYTLYALRHGGERPIRLEVRDRVVLEVEPAGIDRRTVVFPVDSIARLRLDGANADPSGSLDRAFGSIEMEAPGVRLRSDVGGRIVVEGRTLRIEIPSLDD